VNPLPFRVLLYRYFFFDWMFKEIDGDLFQRAAALRHNQRQALWMPTYMWRWTVTAALLYGAGELLEVLLEATDCGFACYLASGACVSAVVAAATVWLGLRRRPA
jgi:hypothetical protein